MNQKQHEQEESHPVGIIQKANEYKQKSSNTMYVISFLLGLLIIIAGYFTAMAIHRVLGIWAVGLLLAIFSIFIARKI